MALPEEIDVVNAGQVEAELISAARQDATLIADMSATSSVTAQARERYTGPRSGPPPLAASHAW